MKKFILGLIVGLLLSGVCYASRLPKPLRITNFDQNGLVTLNETLEQLWDISNGRYTFDVVTSVPTKASLEQGSIKLYSSGGVYKIYIYLNNGWRSFTSD